MNLGQDTGTAFDRDSVHRFTIKGRTYTLAEPCAFHNACIPDDAKNWGDHAGAWLSILAKLADRPLRLEVVHRLVRQYTEVRSRKCSQCADDVAALISIAKLAAEYAYQWADDAGITITPPDIGTGWWPRPSLPTHPDLPRPEGAQPNWVWVIALAAIAIWFGNRGPR